MKFLPSQLAYLTTDPEARGNLRALGNYLAFLAALVAIYTVLFHVIKLNVEHEQHSWVTGFYWTLVVMTTLGFGDITFTSDIGRLFSIVVLLSGVVFLLVMLPFLFIRLFYAPWLEARVRLRAPRDVPADDARPRDHRGARRRSPPGLIERLTAEHIPYVVIEPDPIRAGQLFGDRISRARRRERQPAHLRARGGASGAHGPGQLRRHDQHQHHADGPRGRAGRAHRRRSSRKRIRSTSWS